MKSTAIALAAVAWAVGVYLVAPSHGHGSAHAASPVSYCDTIRERKICVVYTPNPYTNVYFGRFAACAPASVEAAVPQTYDGDLTGVILYCAGGR